MLDRPAWERLCGTVSVARMLSSVGPVPSPGSAALDRWFEARAVRLRDAGGDPVELAALGYGPEHRYLGWSDERQPSCDVAELWLVPAAGQRRQGAGHSPILSRLSNVSGAIAESTM